MTRSIPFAAVFRAIVLFQVAALTGSPVSAMIITVGQAGIPGNCTTPTLAEALEKASDTLGPDEIWVTNDVQPGTYDNQHLVIDNFDVDIIGGFDNCWSPSPTGRSRISAGDGVQQPVLKIRGGGVINLKHLDIEAGLSGDARRAAGVDYSGHGSLTIEDVRIAGNENSYFFQGTGGLSFEGRSGTAYLQLLDDVSVVDNTGYGVTVFGSAMLTMSALRNKIARNSASGLGIESPAVADIGAEGTVFESNEKYGLEIAHRADTPATLESHLYAAHDGLPGFNANKRGALHMEAPAHNAGLYFLCVKGAYFENHSLIGTRPNGTPEVAFGSLVRVVGPLARLQMAENCSYPSDAIPRSGNGNIFVHNNVMADGKPVFAVSDGAVAVIDRGMIQSNTASAVFSTNLGESASDAGLHAYNTIVTNNTLRDDVIESLHGAYVSAVNLTIADNHGDFTRTLIAVDASGLAVADSIIDQTQAVLHVEGNDGATSVQRVLAQNRIGTSVDDLVIEGRPAFGSFTWELAPWSLGVDYASAVPGESVDFYGRPRNVDTLGIDNTFGPCDLGAVELQLVDYDTLFGDGFD